MDSEGHIRVTDFGLAKAGMRDGERSNSLIGTMEYMAPEIISASGHNKVCTAHQAPDLILAKRGCAHSTGGALLSCCTSCCLR